MVNSLNETDDENFAAEMTTSSEDGSNDAL